MAMPAATAILPGEGRAFRVRGLVQGVGFRPTVWRLARACGLAGEVWNDAEGIMIRAWGRPADLDRFLRRLEDQPPPLARIDAVEWALSADSPADGGFHIVSSRADEPWRNARSFRSPLSLSVYELRALRAAALDRAGGAVRPVQHQHGSVPPLPSMPGRVRRSGRSPLSCPADGLSVMRTARVARALL